MTAGADAERAAKESVPRRNRQRPRPRLSDATVRLIPPKAFSCHEDPPDPYQPAEVEEKPVEERTGAGVLREAHCKECEQAVWSGKLTYAAARRRGRYVLRTGALVLAIDLETRWEPGRGELGLTDAGLEWQARGALRGHVCAPASTAAGVAVPAGYVGLRQDTCEECGAARWCGRLTEEAARRRGLARKTGVSDLIYLRPVLSAARADIGYKDGLLFFTRRDRGVLIRHFCPAHTMKCRKCGQPTRVLNDAVGKWVRVDDAPDADGKFAVDDEGLAVYDPHHRRSGLHYRKHTC